MNIDSGIGLELIERQITLELFNNLNNEIEAQQTKWTNRDEEWNQLTAQEPSEVRLELVEPWNFHKGHRPSLIENPPRENYPNVSTMLYQGRPTQDIIDQASNFEVVADIELMVKGDYEMETNSRIHRTVEAVHQVLVRSENLSCISYGWNNDPLIQITDVFKRREDTSYGRDWYWQAARLRYMTIRHNRLPAAL